MVKHMVLERKSEPEVRKGVLGKRKRARIQKKTPPEKKQKNRAPYVTFFCSPGLQNLRQNGPRNLEKAVFDIFFQYEKKQTFPDAVLLCFLTFPGGANPQNRAKTMYCRSKSKIDKRTSEIGSRGPRAQFSMNL